LVDSKNKRLSLVESAGFAPLFSKRLEAGFFSENEAQNIELL